MELAVVGIFAGKEDLIYPTWCLVSALLWTCVHFVNNQRFFLVLLVVNVPKKRGVSLFSANVHCESLYLRQ